MQVRPHLLYQVWSLLFVLCFLVLSRFYSEYWLHYDLSFSIQLCYMLLAVVFLDSFSPSLVMMFIRIIFLSSSLPDSQ